MKKLGIGVAIVGLIGMYAGAARAESSVTLYGLIDAGFLYTNNVGTGGRFALNSGSVNGSRWGLRGIEDLGSGFAAIFVLENGFSVNNGTASQQSREFGRQAFVGLTSKDYGSVTLGRQYESSFDYLGPLSLTGGGYGGTISAHPYDNDTLNGTLRVDNVLRYASVSYNGLKFGGTYAFSNGTNFGDNRLYSGGVSYRYGGFSFAGAYTQVNNSVNVATAPGAITSAPLSASSERIFGAGLNYAIGHGKVGFVFTQSKFENATGVSYNLAAATALPAGSYIRFNNFEVNGRYDINPAWTVLAAYVYTQGRESGFNGNASSPKFQTASIMTDYMLSKRTDIYMEAVYLQSNGRNYIGSTSGNAGVSLNGAGTPSSTNKQLTVALGMRHRF